MFTHKTLLIVLFKQLKLQEYRSISRSLIEASPLQYFVLEFTQSTCKGSKLDGMYQKWKPSIVLWNIQNNYNYPGQLTVLALSLPCCLERPWPTQNQRRIHKTLCPSPITDQINVMLSCPLMDQCTCTKTLLNTPKMSQATQQFYWILQQSWICISDIHM